MLYLNSIVVPIPGLLPQYYLPAYSASKHGVTALSRAIGVRSPSLIMYKVLLLLTFTITPIKK